MRRVSLLLTACCLLAVPAYGRDKPMDIDALLKPYAPFIDGHTMVFARIDIARVPPELIEDWAKRLVPDQAMLRELKAPLADWKQFRDSGIKSLAVAWGPGDMPYAPCVLIETDEKADEKKIAEEIGQAFYHRRKAVPERLHGFLCMGEPGAMKLLKTKKPVDRPEFRAALKEIGSGNLHIAYSMDESSRKILEELSPELPAKFGGGPTTQLTRSVEWMAAGIDLSGKGSIKILTRTRDGETAKALGRRQTELLDAALQGIQAKDPLPEKAFPKVRKLVLELATPKVEANSVHFDLEIESTARKLIKLGMEILESEKR